MIPVIIALLLVLLIILKIEGCIDFIDGMFAILIGVIVAAVLMVPSDMMAQTLPDRKTGIDKTITCENICAFEDNISGSGNYFLLSGSYEEEPCYYYVVERDYGMKTEWTYAEESYLKFDLKKDEQPYKETIIYRGTKFTDKFILFPFKKVIVVFHIPEGSLQENYNIDLK